MANLIQMPKACISCANFTPIAKKFDPKTPARDKFGYIGNASWPYGRCSKVKSRVWGTELCSHFKADELIEVVDVTEPRQAPFEPRQDALI